ncbi:MAG: ABC transporter substrate-binding protein [Rhodobacteraceae bacterium]|nr:ABC transporter substrate-binding protein [Paracoccaceae bacterium]
MWACAKASERRSGPRAFARGLALAAGVACGAAGGVAADTATPPARVVSMNVCTDQLALLIAAPGQIAALSPLATDAEMSALAALAAGLPQTTGGAEDIYLRAPDLVLADVWSDPGTLAMLTRLGVPVEQFSPGVSVPDIRAKITRMGEVLGQGARAAAVLADFDARLAAIERPAQVLRAAVYGAGGYGYGPKTLEGQILALAGFENLVAGPGLDWGGRLDLEALVLAAPDLVIAGVPGASRAEAILAHPALAGLRVEHGLRDAAWVCAAPAMADAVAGLAAYGRRIELENIKASQ